MPPIQFFYKVQTKDMHNAQPTIDAQPAVKAMSLLALKC